MKVQRKTIIEYLDELVDFYSATKIDNINFLKKLTIENIKDAKKIIEENSEAEVHCENTSNT